MATLQNLNFVPTSVSGCTLWLDAADSSTVITSAGAVTQWNDKSGLGNNTTAYLGTTNYLQTAVNGRNAMRFNQSYFTGGFASAYTGTQVQAFAVASLNSSAGANARLFSLGRPGVNDFDSTTTTFMMIRLGGGQNVSIGRNSVFLSANLPAYATLFLGQSYHNGSTEYIGLNGTLSPSSSNTSSTNFNITSYGVGANTSSTDVNYWDGFVCEIIYYTGLLTTFQRQQVEGYLAWKWGLQANLPTAHPFYLYAPNSQNLPYPASIPVSLPRQAFLPNSNPLVYWNPLLVSGCQLWLDAYDSTSLALSGTTVSQWRDKSGNGRNTSNAQGTSTYTSGVGINGRSAVYLNNTYFLGPMSITGSSLQAFGVATLESDANSYGYLLALSAGSFSWNNVSSVNPFGREGTTNTLRFIRNGLNTSISTALTYGSPFLVGGYQVANTGYINVNGGPFTSGSTGTSANFGITTYGIGGDCVVGSTEKWKGYVGEMLVYNTALTLGQQQQIEGYLAWKWGLQGQLPSNHPYKNAVPGINITIPIPLQSFQPANFRPTQFSGLQIWLDASDLNGNGTNPPNNSVLSAWVDKSSNSYSLIQPTASNQPTYTTPALNGLGGVQVTTTTWLYRAGSNMTNFATGSNTSVFMVARNASANTSWNIFHTFFFNSAGSGTTNARYHLSFNSNTSQGLTLLLTNSTTKLYNASWVTPPLSNAIVGFTVSPSFTTLNWNGNLQTGTGVNLPNSADDTLFVFQDPRAIPSNSNCIIYEMVGYNTQLTTPQTQSIEGYLAWKWGLQGNLPSTHPFKRFPPPPI